MNIRRIDADYSVAGQITPAEVKGLAEAGYQSILCARPDNEEAGQPAHRDVARAAAAHGLAFFHLPVSGPPGAADMARFRDAFAAMPKPVLAYCRSGARAGRLYQGPGA